MSTLIKGMDKPDHCLRCPVKGIDDECLLQSEAANADYESWEDQMANCPLVPVPKHGRLIDGDVAEGIYFTEEDENGKDFCDGILYAADWISKQPTIIPAEECE